MHGVPLSLLLGSACVLTVPTPAAAAEPRRHGADEPATVRAPRLRLAPLIGAALPFGEVSSGFELREATPGALLVGADVGWGPILALDFGLVVATTFGLGEPQICPQPSSSCSLAHSGQLALRARYHFLPERSVNPWLGVGGGLDLLKITGQSTMTRPSLLFSDGVTTERSSMYVGPLGALLTGVDVRVSRRLSLGALASLALASYFSQYDSVQVDGETVTSSSGSVAATRHYWLYLAAYASFDVYLR